MTPMAYELASDTYYGLGVMTCLAVMARTGAWLPLVLLMWSLLFMGAIASDVSCFVTTETDHFPDIVLGPFWIGHRLSPSISSR